MNSWGVVSKQSWREHKDHVEFMWVLSKSAFPPLQPAVDLKEMKHQEDGSIAHLKG